MDTIKFKRFCKVLQLESDPELIEEYKLRHSAVWPEIIEGLKKVGVLDMEIYLHGNMLFMIMDTVPEFDDTEAMGRLAGLPRQAEWESEMSTYQKTSPEASASEKWQLIERVFDLNQYETREAREGQLKTMSH